MISVPVNGSVYSIAQGPHGWVAVGRSAMPGASPIWFSEDGVNWVAATSIPLVIFEEAILTQVIAGGPGYIAAGTDFLIDGGPPFAWTSSDGLHWTAASFADGVTLGRVDSLVEVGGRFFAGGSLVGDGGFGTGPAVMWSSANASDWAQTILESGGATGSNATAPVSFADEYASVGGAYTPYTGLVWTSRDGAQWSAGPGAAALARAYLRDVAVIAGQLVAVGAINGESFGSVGEPAIWSSEDGRIWKLLYAGPCCSQIQHVAAFGNGALAFAGNVVYLSEDGINWRLGGSVGGFSGEVVDLTVTPSVGLLAVGNDDGENYLLVPPPN